MTQDNVASAFQVEALIKAAQERTGSTGSEALNFIEPLEVLAHALDTEAKLTPAGRVAVRNGLVSSLETQIAVQRRLQEHPEIQHLEVARPVFLIGMPRTGSTLVHNLLAQHPGLRAPTLWELMFPATVASSFEEQENLADRAQAYVDEYFQVAPQLSAIHFLDARRPDECHRLLGTTFQSMIYETRYYMPSYASWLCERDMTEAYAYHRVQLQNILWRRPHSGPVVLKCPFHTWNLDVLVRTYPDARFVYLHRDPTVVVVSMCSLCAAIRVARSDSLDRAEIGQHWLTHIEHGLEKMQEARQTVLADAPVLDVHYSDLIHDTIGVMSQISTFAGVPMTEQAEQNMQRYLLENRQHKHGTHHYTPQEFGLDRDDLDARFREYRDQYGFASAPLQAR